MSDEALVVFSTFGSVEEARKVCRQLVEERLVACANLVPAVESIYRWQGSVEMANETLALMKTTNAVFARLKRGCGSCTRMRSRKSSPCRSRRGRCHT